MMNDECKTTKVLLQENGIVRDIETGNIIGRLTYLEREDQPESDLNMRSGEHCQELSLKKE